MATGVGEVTPDQMAALGSSKIHTWQTPKRLFLAVQDYVIKNYGGPFELDAAASNENHLAPRWYTEEQNALDPRNPWRGRVWCNPPYGDQIPPFMLKAFESAQAGAVVAMLIPARTDTRAFHEIGSKAAEILFLKGRVTFMGAPGNAPFSSAVLIFAKTAAPCRLKFWDPFQKNLAFDFG